MLNKILHWIWGRRSLENPNVSLSDPAVWNEMGLGGGTSSTGLAVNKETALTLDTVWRATNLIAGTVGRLPCQVFRRNGNGWDLAPKHPAHRLLKRTPLPGMTPRTFKRLLTSQALLHGAGYAYVVRDNNAVPREIWPLDSVATWPVRVNGVTWIVTTIDNIQRKLPVDDVLCILGATKNGWTPYSVFDKARESIGAGLATAKYSAKFFANGAAPRVVIEAPNAMPAEARKTFIAEWERMHQGLDNAHRTAILTNGSKVNAFSVNAEDSQLLETRRFTVREIANWFGLPVHKLQDTAKASYNSLEQENQSFVDDSLEDWLIAWEEECESKLLTEREKESDEYKVEFKRRNLVRAPLKDRAQAYSVMINARILNPNEARAEEGWNPYDGGDEYLVPKNIGNPGGDPTATPQGDPPVNDDGPSDPAADRQATLAAHRRLIVETARRAIRRIGTHARRAAAQPRKFLAWLDDFRAEHEVTCRDMMTPVVSAAAPDADLCDVLDQIFRSIHDGLLDVSGQYKADGLAKAVDQYMGAQESDGAEAVADLLIRRTHIYEENNHAA